MQVVTANVHPAKIYLTVIVLIHTWMDLSDSNGACQCTDTSKTFCSNYKQCIDLSSPTSFGTLCDDIQRVPLQPVELQLMIAGQCKQTCPHVAGIEQELFNGACVSKCPLGA
jgi:hypothetical protein